MLCYAICYEAPPGVDVNTTLAVAGHTPHGNCPTVIKSPGAGGVGGVELIMADTSYSNMKAGDIA